MTDEVSADTDLAIGDATCQSSEISHFLTEGSPGRVPQAVPLQPDEQPIRLAQGNLHGVRPATFLARLRYQLLLGLLLAVVLPGFVYNVADFGRAFAESSSVNTAAGSFAALIIAVYLFRRVMTLPGVGIMGHALPAVAAGYGLVLAVFFALRLDYSRLTFAGSYAGANIFFFIVSAYLRRRSDRRFYIVPSETTSRLTAIPGIDWVVLREPRLPDDPTPVLIADLRADLGDDWERLVAQTAVAGNPVYHVKQVTESLTGRVEIEHLSENSFGSLIPNLSYRKIKRIIDLAGALIVLPFLLAPFFIVAVAIRVDSPGPIFFRQKRRGYRGEIFQVLKFRTMSQHVENTTDREDAITRAKDIRITRVGRFLRRTRIDELPQVWNIIKGDMSWIGPRPEALALSEWYQAELPFYTYRHIVRPGITGWAQVNQGHVADLGEVLFKLQYDFYYVKNFSAWLDLLILGRTIAIVFSGFGAK